MAGSDAQPPSAKWHKYRAAGVDVEAGAALVQAIGPAVATTHRAGVMGGLGGFGAVFDLKATGYADPLLVTGTDGVGTKLKLAIEMDRHDTIGIDLVAMSVNDVVVQGAAPLFFLDYFATGKLDVGVAAKVITGIAQGCVQAGCALVGGETAEMPEMYPPGVYDLAGFAVGAVERDRLLPARVKAGDALVGLYSSGIHSNGFSLVRKIMVDSGQRWRDPFGSRTLGECFLTPTRIYVSTVLELCRWNVLHAAAHITGGGLIGNVPRVLPDGLTIKIDRPWVVPAEFGWLRRTGGLSSEDMLQTFNCGIGMVLVVPANQASRVSGPTIGEVVPGTAPSITLPDDEWWRSPE